MKTARDTNPANTFTPHFMPEQTIYTIAAGGIADYVKSVPKCMVFDDADALLAALAALGFPYTEAFEYTPYSPGPGQTFAGGPRDGKVPWIVVSPVPQQNDQWRADQGAFAVNAGVYGYFWRESDIVPFVGSSYHQDLIADIHMRIEAAMAGQPNLGIASAT